MFFKGTGGSSDLLVRLPQVVSGLVMTGSLIRSRSDNVAIAGVGEVTGESSEVLTRPPSEVVGSWTKSGVSGGDDELL